MSEGSEQLHKLTVLNDATVIGGKMINSPSVPRPIKLSVATES